MAAVGILTRRAKRTGSAAAYKFTVRPESLRKFDIMGASSTEGVGKGRLQAHPAE